MQRIGQVIGIKPEHLAAYRKMHDEAPQAWPEVVAAVRQANIRNYTIFLHGELLFASFEYGGVDLDADMARLANDPKVQEYWSHIYPMQQPLVTRQPGEHWAMMEEIYHAE